MARTTKKSESSNFFEALHQIAMEKGISREALEEIVDAAMLSAYKKQYGQNDNVKVVIDREDNSVKLLLKKMLVKNPQDLANEVAYDEIIDKVRKKDVELELGDEVEVEEDPFKLFGRIAVQTARQVILQKIKEEEKQIIYNEFKDREGELINGEILRKSGNTLFIKLGRTEGILPRKEQSPNEHYKVGDRIKTVLKEVQTSPKGPSVILSRVSPEFICRLFEIEIPEVYDGIVEVRSIVREPGLRTKVAVTSEREDIDCVGACVGMKGIRIQSIVRELEGEKVDVVEYSRNKRIMAENALTPAKVSEVIEKRDGGVIAVIDNDQYRLAIGRLGHNARLANRLCDFEIEVMSEEDYAVFRNSDNGRLDISDIFSNEDEDITPLEELPELEERVISLLEAGGIFSVEDLVETSYEDLLKIDGIGEVSASRIIEIIEANVEFEDDEDEDESEDEVEEEIEQESDDESVE